eukprot:TRINITY_DN35252_c0_g1_i1.p1 TRINITY_DN35252_c0_g1~~TRINITY_DN35252_c0_g1_i1.p1  ORF type:complete len:333 (+),score=45.07 TRINITY_DN35252_c0_g1_i1:62-1000(+)
MDVQLSTMAMALAILAHLHKECISVLAARPPAEHHETDAGPENCVESVTTRRSTDVLFYYKAGNQVLFAAKDWFGGHRAAHDGCDFMVVGNPVGAFYRRCLKPKELQNGATCESVYLPDILPDTNACEAKSKRTDAFEKGEEGQLVNAVGQRKILNDKTALTPKDLGCEATMNISTCILVKSKQLVEIDLTPENAGLAAPMHVRARLIELPRSLAQRLKLPQPKGLDPIDPMWISCVNATQFGECKEGTGTVTKWNFIHAAVVKKSGLCLSSGEGQSGHHKLPERSGATGRRLCIALRGVATMFAAAAVLVL